MSRRQRPHTAATSTDMGNVASQGIPEYEALKALGVTVSLGGRRVVAPPGVIDAEGLIDLTQAKQD